MWTIHRVAPKSIIVSCRLTDNMAQGIHLRGTDKVDKLVNWVSCSSSTLTVNMLSEATDTD